MAVQSGCSCIFHKHVNGSVAQFCLATQDDVPLVVFEVGLEPKDSVNTVRVDFVSEDYDVTQGTF